jgi:hypothetical protein
LNTPRTSDSGIALLASVAAIAFLTDHFARDDFR